MLIDLGPFTRTPSILAISAKVVNNSYFVGRIYKQSLPAPRCSNLLSSSPLLIDSILCTCTWSYRGLGVRVCTCVHVGVGSFPVLQNF